MRSAHAAGRHVLLPLLAAGLMFHLAPADAASRIEEVVSPGGIRAYLISEPAVPILSLSLDFRDGAALDPVGKEGLAYMASALIDEGAGPYDSQAFRAELDDNAIRLSFDATRDGFSGRLKTLSANREHAFELLRLALTEPRFDEEPVERIRGQLLADLARRNQDPDYIASLTFLETAFPDHPYGRPVRGTLESVAAIDIADLRGFVTRQFDRERLTIGVAGDITAAELAPLLDRVFGALPSGIDRRTVPDVLPEGGETVIVRRSVPQSVVNFGLAGIARDDPDYYAAYVANYILGGGGFTSRLTTEVREKRGLAYSVYSYLTDFAHAPMWMGGVSTKNEQVVRSIELIRREIGRMASGDVSADELADAKTYLTGSFPLRLTSNDQIAAMLVGIQIHDLGIDYLERRNGHIEAVTLDDVHRAAARFLDPAELLVVVVGDPDGMEG